MAQFTSSRRAGSCRIDLTELGADKARFDFGGLDIGVCVERYPTTLTDVTSALTTALEPPRRHTTLYFIKVVQADGHMAWSSPIYVR